MYLSMLEKGPTRHEWWGDSAGVDRSTKNSYNSAEEISEDDVEYIAETENQQKIIWAEFSSCEC